MRSSTSSSTLFPDTVRAAVLDGAVDPTAGLTELGVQQAAGFEHTLATYLATCSADADCAFHNDGDAEGAFDDLMRSLDDEPIPSESGRPDITRGVALQAVAMAMYDTALWDQLSDALVDAQHGDGAGLLALWDTLLQPQPRRHLVELPRGVPGHQVHGLDRAADRRRGRRHRPRDTSPWRPASARAPPVRTSARSSRRPSSHASTSPGAGAGPIVVIGTTGDPATPLAGTRVMASTLEDGRLIVVTADKHTGYGENDCVDGAVDKYLIDLEVPGGDRLLSRPDGGLAAWRRW